MSLRETLLNQKPQLTPIDIKGTTYFIRAMTVGDMNNVLFCNQLWLKKQAELEGVELPNEEDEQFEKALNEFGVKYNLAQSIAMRLCDEEGNLLFDMFNMDDLNAIASLDTQVLTDFNKGLGEPKNSQTADDSN